MPTERFTKDHEYIRIEEGSDIGVVGITAHAAEQLGDIVYVQVPETGQKVKAHEACAVAESVKAASDVYSPVSGEVTEVNAALAHNPALVNESAEDNGWFYKMRIANKSELDQLMDRAAYDAFVKEGS
jgi:glycine cleavage system H protein